jgi:hypothetical protein
MEHYSDCATNNAPAMEQGECDCGGLWPFTIWASWLQFNFMLARRIYAKEIGRPIPKTRGRGGRPRGQGETNRNSDTDDIEQLWEVL